MNKIDLEAIRKGIEHDGEWGNIFPTNGALLSLIAELEQTRTLLDEVSKELTTTRGQLSMARANLIDTEAARAEAEREAGPINRELLGSIMHAVVMCDEEVGEDGLCECARAIGFELRRFERKAQRGLNRARKAEADRNRLAAQVEATDKALRDVDADLDKLSPGGVWERYWHHMKVCIGNALAAPAPREQGGPGGPVMPDWTPQERQRVARAMNALTSEQAMSMYRTGQMSTPTQGEDKRTRALAWFTEQMRAKLDANRDKGDNWEEMGISWLFDRIATDIPAGERLWYRSELEELEEAIEKQDWAEVIHEAADVANFAMMIADTARNAVGTVGPQPTTKEDACNE